MYHHGVIEKYTVRALTSLNLTFGSFTDDNTKILKASLTEGEKVSLLELKYDKDHNEVFNIHRGMVKEISTIAVRSNMSKQSMMECITIKIDCSTPGNSDVRYIKLCDIVEVHDIDYEYEELNRYKYSLDKNNDDWIEDKDRVTTINIDDRYDILIEE